MENHQSSEEGQDDNEAKEDKQKPDKEMEDLFEIYKGLSSFLVLPLSCNGSASQSNLPLQAGLMLERFSLLVNRPSCINKKAMSRKALVLAQFSQSPSLKEEIRQELLARHLQPAPTYSYLYHIPIPPSPRRHQRKASSAKSVSDHQNQPQQLPFSQSRIFRNARDFYQTGGEHVWNNQVPYGVTTNAFLANAYARVLIAYMKDLSSMRRRQQQQQQQQQQKDDDAIAAKRRTMYIFETAAGHCLFGCLLARQLLEQLKAPSSSMRQQQEQEEEGGLVDEEWQVRIILTDFNRSLLERRMTMPWIRTLMDDGILDFAVLDASDDANHGGSSEALELLSEKGSIAPRSLEGPVVVIASYAIDSFPTDIFIQWPPPPSEASLVNASYAAKVESSSSSSGANRGKEKGSQVVVDDISGQFHLAPFTSEEMARYEYQELLQAMMSRGESGLHVVSVGLLNILQRLKALMSVKNRDVAVLVGDGVFQYDDQHWLDHKAPHAHYLPNPSSPLTQALPDFPFPDMSPCPAAFAMAVDMQAIAMSIAWVFEDGDEAIERVDQSSSDENAKAASTSSSAAASWLAVRNTQVEGSLTISLIARATGVISTATRRTADQGKDRGLSSTMQAFWRYLCLVSPTDFEQLEGLVAEGGGGRYEGANHHRSLATCLGLKGLLALLRWSSYDGELFLTIYWELRDLLLQRRESKEVQLEEEGDSSGSSSSKEGEELMDIGRESSGVSSSKEKKELIEIGCRCLLNRVALGTGSWHHTRYQGLQWLYAMGGYTEIIDTFLKDVNSAADSDVQDVFKTFSDFGTYAQAFLISRTLECLGHDRLAIDVMKAAIENPALKDGKGRKRIKGKLKALIKAQGS